YFKKYIYIYISHMSGEVPPPMSGTCGCSLNGDMYIFGGCNDNGQTNQLYCVNLLDGKYSWRKVNHKSGSSPSPRDKLSCWVFNGSKAVRHIQQHRVTHGVKQTYSQ
uniref:Uncharacterized protein n=1 Tax=Hucho hucho TaxID=62062 RepID=A0A4W5LMN4_9TELE